MGFFKAYDMRGPAGVDFDFAGIYRIGKALPEAVGRGRWLVGRDCRETGEAMRDALVSGLLDAGADVVDMGLCTTPMVYFFTAKDGFDGSAMITASHNPPGDNGIKVSRKTALPAGYDPYLAKVEKIAGSAKGGEANIRKTGWTDAGGWLERYCSWQEEATPSGLFANLKYAVDCSCGMASLLAERMFPGAIVLNGKPDGRFPAHSPNPLAPEARGQIARAVRENALDCGIIFDGDADRAMFVDENGDFVQPDFLIPFVARASRAACGTCGGEIVLHDVRTSRGTIEALAEDGFKPVAVPVGHAFAKPKMRELDALCGGELAGHYYFREFSGCDSGVLAARRILSQIAAAKQDGETFSSVAKRISGRYANSGEINFRMEDKDAAIERIVAAAEKNFPRELSRSDMDGIRIEYEDGWINVRKSNTEPCLRLLAEAKTRPLLDERLAILEDALEAGR